ncbi:hypothetical protein DIE22_34135 [Burkholderia sp. Bp9142]|nr:hypothetical protein DIE22_34135 [Burkholderia sp. Bp9142]RQR54662.1 hypothetical protein DIE21_07435 [Burkholderia sp. Bp9140]
MEMRGICNRKLMARVQYEAPGNGAAVAGACSTVLIIKFRMAGIWLSMDDAWRTGDWWFFP